VIGMPTPSAIVAPRGRAGGARRAGLKLSLVEPREGVVVIIAGLVGEGRLLFVVAK
jgi:hypothetical protein